MSFGSRKALILTFPMRSTIQLIVPKRKMDTNEMTAEELSELVSRVLFDITDVILEPDYARQNSMDGSVFDVLNDVAAVYSRNSNDVIANFIRTM